MSLARKVRNAVKLTRQGDFQKLVEQTHFNLRLLRVKGSRGLPFAHSQSGFPFICFPEITDSRHIYLQGVKEDGLELRLLRAWLRSGDGMIDAGANLGIYSVFAAHQVGPTGMVLALEPSPVAHAALLKTSAILKLPQLKPVDVAVNEDDSDSDFFVTSADGDTGIPSFTVNPFFENEFTRIQVQGLTLGSLVKEHFDKRSLTCIKVDIEGAEIKALRGTSSFLLRNTGPLWMIELNPEALARYASEPHEVASHFDDCVFERWLLPKHARNGQRCAPPRKYTSDEAFTDALFYNLIAVPRGERFADRLESVRTLLAG